MKKIIAALFLFVAPAHAIVFINNPPSSSGGNTLPLPPGDTNYVQISTNGITQTGAFRISSGTVRGQLQVIGLAETGLFVQTPGAVSQGDYEVGRFDTAGAGNGYVTLGSNSTGGGYMLYEKANGVIRFGTHGSGYFARFGLSGAIVTTSANSGLSEAFDGAFKILPAANTVKGLVIKSVSGQSADLQEWQNSGGTPLSTMDSAGKLGVGVAVPTVQLDVQGAGASAGSDYEIGRFNTSGSGNPYFTLGNAASGGGYVLYEKTNNTIRYGAHGCCTYFVRMSTGGALVSAANGNGLNELIDSAFKVFPSSPSIPVIVAKGAFGQSGDLQEWKNSANVILSSVASNGDFVVSTITVKRLIVIASAPPSLSSCGSTPNGALSTNSSDLAGTITVGGTATGCTLTFAQPSINKPTCVLTNQSMSVTSAMSYTTSTTALTISQAVGLSGDLLDYICTAH